MELRGENQQYDTRWGKSFRMQVWGSEVVPNFSVLITFYVQGYLQGTYITKMTVSG